MMQVVCSTSRRTTCNTASSRRLCDQAPVVASKENLFINVYMLEDLLTCQSLGALQFTNDDPDFVKDTVERVYLLIQSMTTAQEMPLTRAF